MCLNLILVFLYSFFLKLYMCIQKVIVPFVPVVFGYPLHSNLVAQYIPTIPTAIHPDNPYSNTQPPEHHPLSMSATTRAGSAYEATLTTPLTNNRHKLQRKGKGIAKRV